MLLTNDAQLTPEEVFETKELNLLKLKVVSTTKSKCFNA
jgi:hypothetical protein